MRKRIATRALLLLVTGVSLYVLWPSLLTVFSSWRSLRELEPLWLGAAALFEAASFLALWSLQRIALQTPSWFAVGTSQLAANAAGRVVPGGIAASGAVQYRMLVRAGVRPARVAAGLGAAVAATTATALALPILASIAAIGGAAAPRGLIEVAYVGAAAFVLMAIASGIALGWNRPLKLVGQGIRAAASWLRRRPVLDDLPVRLLEQRNAIRDAFRARPWTAALGAIGKWGFDYLALVCVLAAVGSRPTPALVLLAYAAASLLGLIPVTPGGLGFVEAGLTGLLTLAGTGAADAALATLTYRLISFWLPLPAGLVAVYLFRRRYSSVPASPDARDRSASTTSP